MMIWSEAVRLAREGKEEGFNFLYEQTYQKSYYTALKYMKQEEAAADVVQEAYIKAFSSLEQLQDAEKFTGWLSRIVAAKALDELRKKKMVLFSQLQTDDEEISMEELLADERIDIQPELALDQEETLRAFTPMQTVTENSCIYVGFYLTYLPSEKLLAGDLIGSSVVLETYSLDAESGNLLAADTYTDEGVGTVGRKDIIYYRIVEQAIENIGAVQE